MASGATLAQAPGVAGLAPQWRGLALNDVCAEAAVVAPGAEDVAIYHVTATLAATTRVIFTRAALTPVSTAIPATAHTVSQARGKAACQGQGVPARAVMTMTLS